MLVLERSEGKYFIIELPTGEKIYIYLIGVQNHKAKIGIKAKSCINIYRSEVEINGKLSRS